MTISKSAPNLLLLCLSFTLVSCWNRGALETEVLANDGIYSAAFDEIGSLALISSIYGGASLWHSSNKQQLVLWAHDSIQDQSTHLVAITDNGKLAATVSNNINLSIWNGVNGEHIASFQSPSKINQLTIVDQSNAVIVALDNHTSLLIDITSGSTLAVFNHQSKINSVDLNINKSIAITGSADQSAKIWNLLNHQQSWQLEHNAAVDLVKLSPDGSLALTVAKYDKAMIWNTNNATARGEIPLSKSLLRRGRVFTAAEFSSDNQWLLTGTTAGIVQLWNIENFNLERQWKMPKRYFIRPDKSAVLAVAFSSNHHYSAITTNGLLHRFN
jgi:WD40 repeat protein